MLSHKQNTGLSLMQKHPWTKGCCFRVLSPSLRIAFEIRRSEGGRKEGGRGGEETGVFSCCFSLVWKVCVAVNSTPATCILASFSEIQRFFFFLVFFFRFLSDLLGIHHAAVVELCSRPFLEEDESAGRGCAALLGQPVSGWDLFTV